MKGIPNVLQYRTHNIMDRKCWIVTDYIQGRELYDCLEKVSELNLTKEEASNLSKRLVQLMIVLSHTCHKLEEQGMVHRDLKPSNIMIRSFGPREMVGSKPWCPVIIDFGYSCLQQGQKKYICKKKNLGNMGTPGYYPTFDKNSDTKEYDWSSNDVFSLALVFRDISQGDDMMEDWTTERTNHLLKSYTEDKMKNVYDLRL